jgi:SagB-type dehydrogenase family enzyme
MAHRIGQQFMELTKYQHLEQSDQMKNIPAPGAEWEFDHSIPRIPLSDPQAFNIGSITLCQALDNRQSIRHFSRDPLTLDELSYLLWHTQGVKEQLPHGASLRPVPSAGARHAFETLLLINRVEGVEPGIYRFLAYDHCLIPYNTGPDIAEEVTRGCLSQTMVRKGNVTFIWVAVPYRMTWRYSERGYRYLHLDAGHVCQNLYLAAEAIHCGTCAIAAFADDDLNRVLNLDGVNQFAIYLAALGKK